MVIVPPLRVAGLVRAAICAHNVPTRYLSAQRADGKENLCRARAELSRALSHCPHSPVAFNGTQCANVLRRDVELASREREQCQALQQRIERRVDVRSSTIASLPSVRSASTSSGMAVR